MKNNNFAERLISAMDQRGMKAQELSRTTGIDKASISSYRNGKYKASSKNLYLIADALQVNPAWLMGSDEVPMDSRKITAHTLNASYEYLADALIQLNDIETQIIEHYRLADEQTKHLVNYLLHISE